MHFIARLIVAVLLLHSIFFTMYWFNLSRTFRRDGLNYEQKRIQYAFMGIPIDEIGKQLDLWLDVDAKISLSPSILKNEFLHQRFTEGLYPRLMDRNAPYLLEISTAQSIAPKNAVELVKLRGSESVYLLSQAPPPWKITTRTPTVDTQNQYRFSWIGFLLPILSILGYGGLFLWFIQRKSRNTEHYFTIAISIILGALFIGLTASVMSWVQFQLPWHVLLYVGVATCVLLAPFWKKTLSLQKMYYPQSEFVVFLVLLFFSFLKIMIFPIVLWDGRSVWLFNAKKIFFHGMLSKGDALNPEMLFSHPDYPLLFPAWLSHFSSFGGVYNEHMAALAIPILYGASLGLVWFFSRKVLGRFCGSGLTLWLFFLTENLTGGAYVDGFVLIFTWIALLSYFVPSYRWVCTIALMVLSLLKVEGILIAGLMAIVLGLLCPVLEGRVFYRRFFLLLFLVPTLMHRLWLILTQVQSSDPFVLDHLWQDFFPRLLDIFKGIPVMLSNPGYTGTRFGIWDGFFAILAFTVFAVWLKIRQRTFSWPAKACAWLSLCLVIISLIVLILLPHDTQWLVQVTLDRLLLVPSTLMVLGFILLLKQTDSAPLS